jgi:exonuclease SbcD
MKALHIADVHYGRAGQTHWIDRAMRAATETAIAEQCDIAIIAGDLFDHALSSHDPAFLAAVEAVARLGNSLPTVILQGTHSHDRLGALDVFRALGTKHPVTVCDKPEQFELAGALISALPSLNRADPNQRQATDVLASFAEANTRARAEGKPTLVVTHGTVTGSTTESRYAMVGPDHEFGVQELASADADAVLLGHIHRHQSWPDVLTPSGARTQIAYSGSLARLVHGHHDPVGFLIWTLEPGKASFQFHASPARQLLEISFPGTPDLDDLRELAAQVQPDDAVRIRWMVDEEHAASIDKAFIRELFANAESIKLEARVLPVQRVRASGIGKALSLADKLSVWAESTDSKDALERLLPRLEWLQTAEPEQIAARLTEEPQALKEAA